MSINGAGQQPETLTRLRESLEKMIGTVDKLIQHVEIVEDTVQMVAPEATEHSCANARR